jgi:hypothetical protein
MLRLEETVVDNLVLIGFSKVPYPQAAITIDKYW